MSMYAPTMMSTEKIKDQFDADLDSALHDTPTTDNFVILSNFSIRFSMDREQWRGVIGKHGVGKMNSYDLLLLNKCAEHNLLIINTTF